MRLKPKRTVHLKLPIGKPDARAFLAEGTARRRRQLPTRAETDLVAALIARRRKECAPQ